MSALSEQLINEIVRQGAVKIVHPDPDVAHVLVWNSNLPDQLDALLLETVRACPHPNEQRMLCGDQYEWCGKCGSIRRLIGSWQQPDLI